MTSSWEDELDEILAMMAVTGGTAEGLAEIGAIDVKVAEAILGGTIEPGGLTRFAVLTYAMGYRPKKLEE